MTITEKRCAKCLELLPAEMFYRRSVNGLRSKCKTCDRNRMRDWERANRDKARAATRRNRAKRILTAHGLEMERERQRRRKRLNPDSIKREQARYRLRHAGQISASKERWRQNNYERWVEACTEWRKNNPLRVAAYRHKRRALMASAPGRSTSVQLAGRVAYYGWCCWMCAAKLTPATLTLDHVIPLSRGGSNWPSNLRPACLSCNAKKGAKLLHKEAA